MVPQEDLIVEIPENRLKFFGGAGKMLLPSPATFKKGGFRYRYEAESTKSKRFQRKSRPLRLTRRSSGALESSGSGGESDWELKPVPPEMPSEGSDSRV